MQNVVINFEGNVEGLKPAIDALAKIGKITEDDVKEFNRANAAQKEMAATAAQSAGSYDKLATSAGNVKKNIVDGSINKAIEGTGKLIEKNTAETKVYDNSIRGLKQQYKDLISLAIQAGEESPIGQQALRDAGALRDRIGDLMATTQAYASDTATFDAISQGLGTIGAGFQAAEGAQALFGEGNEDVQKTLVRLQAVMALTNGLQEIQNNLQAESALRLKLAAVQQYVLAGAQTAYTVVVGASTGAMKAFRIALAATGIGLIVLALVALVQNFGAVKDAVMKVLDSFEFVKKGIEVLVKAFNWLKKELGFGDQLSDELKKLEEFEKAVIDSYNKQQARIMALRRSKGQNTLDFEKRSNDLLIKEQQKLFETQRKALIAKAVEDGKIDEEARDKYIEDVNTFYDNINKLQARNNDIEYEMLQRALQARKLIVDARLQYAQKGSKEELNLRLAQINAELAMENSARDKIPGQVALNEAKANQARKLAYEEYKAFQIQSEIDTENKRLTIVQVGSQEELSIRRNLLDLENQLTVNNSKLTQSQKELKLAENAQKELELIKKYGQAQISLAEQVEARKQAVGNDRLQKYQDELNAEYQYYNEIADLEFQTADQTYRRIEDLRKEKFARNIGLLDAELSKVEQTNQNILASEEQLQRDLAAKSEKDPANRGQYELAILQSQDRVKTAEQKTADDIVRINREKNKQIIANDNEAEMNRRANLQKQLELVQSFSDQSVGILKTASDLELQDKLEAFDAEAAANQKNLDDKIISQRQYEVNEKEIEKRRNQAKKQAFEQEKNIQIAQTLINTASAVVKALNTQPYPVGVAFAALAAAAGAAQLAVIARTKYPGFAKGTKNAPRGWAWVGEEGPELINLKGGEEIKTAKQSRDFALQDTLATAIDNGPMLNEKAREATELFMSEPSFALDYHMLSSMISQGVGEQISRMPITHFTMDRNGFAVAVATGTSTTRYMDNRYSTN